MTRWLETDTLSNQDISTALAVGTYTADADRLILVQVFADQVAGNGDYVFYVTHQINGAGSSYRMIPITTAAAASGVTAIAAQSGMIAVRSGDVLTVYLDGLAGDNSTPDTTVRWFELAALRPTTPGQTIALDGDGYVTAASVTGDVGGKVLGGGAGVIAGTGAQVTLADDAITAAKYDESTAYPLKLADTGATAVARTGADSDTLETLSDQIDGVGAGTGTGTYTDTVTDGVDPLDNVLVQLSTDSAGANMAYRAYTGADGVFAMHPDPGTYYVWLELAGYSFTQGAEVTVT